MKTIVYLFNNINNDTFLFVWQVELQLFNLQQKKEGNRMMKFIFF